MECKICKSNDVVEIFKKDKYSFLKCNLCQIVFQNPIIEKEIEDYYLNQYYNETRPLNQFVNYFTKEKNFKILKLIQKYKHSGKLLDIGAGYGYFVKNALDASFDARGIEPNRDSIKIAKKEFNINIEKGFFDDKYKPKEKFEVITSFHVIEHVLNPEKLIENIYLKLENNGILVLETPNINSFNSRRLKQDWPYIIANEHIFYFNKKSLSEILKRNGFKILKTISLGPFIYNKPKNISNQIRENSPNNKVKVAKKIYDFISEKAHLGDHLLIIAVKK